MNKKTQLWMFPDETTCNAEIVRFIASNNIVRTRWKELVYDRDNIDFHFYEMEDPGEWYGSMMGVEFETEVGLVVQFAAWFDEEYYQNEGEYLQKVMDAFMLLNLPE